MTELDPARLLLIKERHALDHWADGDPVSYIEGYAEDVTYFDDIAAQRRIDGLPAMRGYAASLAGKIPKHKYQLVDPKVQILGEVGIVTLRYEASDSEGNPLTNWKATSVYRRAGGEWRVVHAHWSMVKE